MLTAQHMRAISKIMISMVLESRNLIQAMSMKAILIMRGSMVKALIDGSLARSMKVNFLKICSMVKVT